MGNCPFEWPNLLGRLRQPQIAKLYEGRTGRSNVVHWVKRHPSSSCCACCGSADNQDEWLWGTKLFNNLCLDRNLLSLLGLNSSSAWSCHLFVLITMNLMMIILRYLCNKWTRKKSHEACSPHSIYLWFLQLKTMSEKRFKSRLKLWKWRVIFQH